MRPRRVLARSVPPFVRRLVRPSVRQMVRNRFFVSVPKMDNCHYENHRGSSTLTLLNVLNVRNVLYVLIMLMDASLACLPLLSLELE